MASMTSSRAADSLPAAPLGQSIGNSINGHPLADTIEIIHTTRTRSRLVIRDPQTETFCGVGAGLVST